ncbi:sulfotransferase [Ferruginivarius sediminum]|uniref:Sulfotransferase n=2 Tax=Ferruginivarius sediminum TaxID=2661937 RepID=A0A369TBI9_9PROT|nr:sulfotransferase [Ferruginivarius sediminum]
MKQRTRREGDHFHVPLWLDILGGLVEGWPELWMRLGEWETRTLEPRIEHVAIRRPIYIAGLARSGSTILLELLARHPEVATHRYRDFPMLHIPWFWNRFVDLAAAGPQAPRERAHRDGIRVTEESPEAFEEMIWMSMFPGLHDPKVCNVLDERHANSEFDSFYTDHLRKLLVVRSAPRYLAKGNYNVTRLRYLLKLFPDARFIIPIRGPVWHVASLMKQHALLTRAAAEMPRVQRYMRRAGHFEFGLDLHAVNVGDPEAVENIQRLWDRGREIEGWARYWSMIYSYIANALETTPELRNVVLVVRFEDMCDNPRESMIRILRHAELSEETLPAMAEKKIRLPAYYQLSFTPDQRRLIWECTNETASRFGYTDVRREHTAIV